MKKSYIIFVLVSIFIFLLSCNEENPIERGYPKVITENPTNITEEGVVFNGNINNYENLDIIEYGFLWDFRSALSNFIDKKVLVNNFNGGKFSAIINSTLIKDQTYFVRAYAKTDKYTIYGNKISFKSQGSNAPEINNVIPKSGTWGDTIKVIGKGFSYVKRFNKVTFNNVVSEVVISNDSVITCIVPPVKDIKELAIKVSLPHKESISDVYFTLNAPEITSISTLTGTFRDELIIKGNNFGKKDIYNEFYFGNVISKLEYINKNTLKVIVPDAIESKSSELKVVSSSISTIYDGKFQLIPPKITNTNKTSMFIGEEIEIKGDYFHPNKDKNIVKFNDIEGKVVSFDNNILRVKVPIGPYVKRDLSVKVEILDMEDEFINTTSILNQWVLVSDDLPFRFYGYDNNYLPAGNSVFLITRQKHYSDNKNYLWKFNPLDFSWSKHNLPSNIIVSNFTSNGEKIYIYDGTNNNFWEYNAINDSWIQKKSYPGIKRGGASHFSINGEVYLGMGSFQKQYTTTNLRDFYKYNSTTDTWVKISDFHSNGNHRRYGSATFVINDIAYLGNGATDTGMNDFWSYNSKTDSWIRIADFVDARHSTAAFSLNNYGYVTGGSSVAGSNVNYCWKYDPKLNTWEKIENVGTVKRELHFSFILDGKAYVGGGGTSGGSNGYDMYQFLPN